MKHRDIGLALVPGGLIAALLALWVSPYLSIACLCVSVFGVFVPEVGSE